MIERLDLADAKATGLDPGAADYTPLGELNGVSDKAIRDGGGPGHQYLSGQVRTMGTVMIKKRTRDWGRDGLVQRFAAAWTDYVQWVDTWLQVRMGVRGLPVGPSQRPA